MSIHLFELGDERARVLVIDNFVEDPDDLVRQAAALAPFPEVDGNLYPGTRRLIMPDRDAAFAYVDLACRGLAPLLQQVWGVEKFVVTEASFSMVTRRPETLNTVQRVPHWDSYDPANFAVLHYLSNPPKGGTAFYRHHRTGFVMLTEVRHETYLAAFARDEDEFDAPPPAYADASTDAWEKIGEVEGLYNRCIIYQGAIFHSGLIPPGFDFSPDPAKGRLTANIFLHATAMGQATA